ncbi:MAG: DNA primase, partial [Oscillospiraceae bacterium]|nr:DNA primase [Oscillospiraceae bacterium]
MQKLIQQILEQIPIADIFQKYNHFRQQGKNYICCCPFHSEKTPSCVIYPDLYLFYCPNCGVGGDVITYLQITENLSYTDAVNTLAQRLNLNISSKTNVPETKLQREKCYKINRETANFYYQNLLCGRDKRGLQYFMKRHLSPQTIKKYGLGFAPDDWHALQNYLHQKGYSDEELILAGVCRKSEKGNIYDNFRNRVIFPIVNTVGNVIGFGGRVLDDSKPKYLNTSNTPVFDKGNHLFSLHFAQNSSSEPLILAEGYMDVIAMNQAGFENVVATLGTAITPQQARLIARYTKEVVIAYDSDFAGQNATQKALKHFHDVGLPARVLHIKNAKDPDEFIKTYGSEKFRILIQNAQDAIDFYLDRCKTNLDLQTEQGKKIMLQRSMQVLAEIQNAFIRKNYIQKIATELEISFEILKMQVDRMIGKQAKNDRKKKFQEVKNQSWQKDEINPLASQFVNASKSEEILLAYLMLFPENAEIIFHQLLPEDFITDFHKKIYEMLFQ